MGKLFGTDGIRGIANRDLDCRLAFDAGRAASVTLSGVKPGKAVFCVGTDTRASSGMLVAALSAGICSTGGDVIDLGVIPTPAVSYLTEKYRADAGIVVSASHNSFEYNGIKIFGSDGRKLPDTVEETIEAAILGKNAVFPSPDGDGVGRIIRAHSAADDYAESVRRASDVRLDGMRIALDCANGAASPTAKPIFEGLGASVTLLSASPDGVNINDSCGSTHPERLSEFVRLGGFDLGAAFDGDADRCICVDENGAVVDGDGIMAVCALDLLESGKLNRRGVVGTVMTNLGFIEFCEENGIVFIPAKVGDRYVLDEMLKADYSFGGEKSGHIIFGDLAATGDGQLTAVRLCSAVKRSGKKLSELAAVMRPYPQITVNVPATPDEKARFASGLYIADYVKNAGDELGNSGRVIVRPSGTEPLIRVTVEARDEKTAAETAEKIAEKVKSSLCGKQ